MLYKEHYQGPLNQYKEYTRLAIMLRARFLERAMRTKRYFKIQLSSEHGKPKSEISSQDYNQLVEVYLDYRNEIQSNIDSRDMLGYIEYSSYTAISKWRRVESTFRGYYIRWFRAYLVAYLYQDFRQRTNLVLPNINNDLTYPIGEYKLSLEEINPFCFHLVLQNALFGTSYSELADILGYRSQYFIQEEFKECLSHFHI